MRRHRCKLPVATRFARRYRERTLTCACGRVWRLNSSVYDGWYWSSHEVDDDGRELVTTFAPIYEPIVPPNPSRGGAA